MRKMKQFYYLFFQNVLKGTKLNLTSNQLKKISKSLKNQLEEFSKNEKIILKMLNYQKIRIFKMMFNEKIESFEEFKSKDFLKNDEEINFIYSNLIKIKNYFNS